MLNTDSNRTVLGSPGIKNPADAVRSTSSRSGFSLIELLTVLTIITIILSISALSFNSITKSWRQSKAIEELSGKLQMARQYAITHNTHVWLGLAESGGSIQLSIFASQTGEEVSGTVVPSAAGSNVQIVEALAVVDKMKFASASEVQSKLTENSVSTGNILQPGTLKFSLTSAAYPSLSLNHVVHFTSLGELQSATGSALPLQVGIKDAVTGQVSVIQINSITGETAYYR
jgi:prepilin-type N-terminal cleavage/methylation domain-containing protein